MKKNLSLVMVGVLAATLFSSAFAQKTELTLMRFFGDCFDEYGETTDLEAASGECGIVQTLTNAFNAQSETVSVETVPIAWPGTTELNANLAAGTPPDIMVLHGIRIPNYASRGVLTPLDDVFASTGVDVGDFTESAAGYVSYNEELFGLPFDLHGHIWHINLDQWEEAGLPLEEGAPILPVGQEQFLEYAVQFKEAVGKPFANTWTNELSRNWMALVYQQGSSIQDEEGNPLIDTPEGLNALNFFLQLRDEEHITDNVDYQAAQEIFLNADAGSHFNGTWTVDFYDEQAADPEAGLSNLYVATFPQIFDQPASWASTHSWVVPLGVAPDADRLAAVGEFLKFLNDNNVQWARTGHISVNQSILDSPDYQALPHRDEYAAGFSSDSVVMPRQGWVTAFETVLNEELTAAFIGDKSPEQALTDAQSRLSDFAAFGQ